MAIAIYALKVWLFRCQANITDDVQRNLLEFCRFVVTIYIEAWFSATDPTSAPRNDLKLLKNLVEYERIHATVARTALRKLTAKHLWYLSEAMIGLSVFDSKLPDEVRKEIVEACLTREGLEDPPPNHVLQISDVPDMALPDLASTALKILEVTCARYV